MPLVTHHKLSKSQHRSYRFAFDLHDDIVKLIHTAERNNAVCITLKGLSEKQLTSLQSVGADGTIDWLESNGFKSDAQEVMRRNITMALSADLCNFTYEALNAAAKGKMVVAYSLIRKPIKENLFFLEWLLADSNEFFSVFEQGDASLLDVSRSIDPQKKKEIIQKAFTVAKSSCITADELFCIRYDKSCPHGFESLCNKATHLITTFKQFKTEGQNFNFIFSDHEQISQQQDYFFGMLPLILLHAQNVIVSLFSTFLDDTYSTNLVRTAVGLGVMQLGFGVTQNPDSMAEILQELFNEISGGKDIFCSDCGAQLIPSLRTAMRYYRNGEIQCPMCGVIG